MSPWLPAVGCFFLVLRHFKSPLNFSKTQHSSLSRLHSSSVILALDPRQGFEATTSANEHSMKKHMQAFSGDTLFSINQISYYKLRKVNLPPFATETFQTLAALGRV